MSRKEFLRSVKVACIKRATNGGQVICEQCGSLAKKFAIDHINADGLTGEPTLANAQLLCDPCHAEKTKADVAAIAKAKRREAAHVGAKPTPKQQIKSPGFAKKERTPIADKLAHLPRRSLYGVAE